MHQTRELIALIASLVALGTSIVGLWKDIGSQPTQLLVGSLGVSAIFCLIWLLSHRFAPGSYLRKP